MDKVFPPQAVDCRIFILPERIYFVSLFGVRTPTFIIEPKVRAVSVSNRLGVGTPHSNIKSNNCARFVDNIMKRFSGL